MIGKIERGQSFRGLVDYLLGAEDHKGELRLEAEIIGGTVLPMPRSNDPGRDLARQFGALRRLRPEYQGAVCHQIFRLAEQDIAKISTSQKAEIADKWCKAMGYEAYVVVSHGADWHVEASRINPDGSVVPDSWEIRRSEKFMHQLRAEYGLVEIAPSHNLDREAKDRRVGGECCIFAQTVHGGGTEPQHNRHHQCRGSNRIRQSQLLHFDRLFGGGGHRPEYPHAEIRRDTRRGLSGTVEYHPLW